MPRVVISFKDGTIAPAMENPEDLGPFPFDNEKCRQHCMKMQADMLATNEAYRREKGLEHKYEHNHFLRTPPPPSHDALLRTGATPAECDTTHDR